MNVVISARPWIFSVKKKAKMENTQVSQAGIANAMVDKASCAAAVFSQLGQEHVDRIVRAVYEARFNNRVRLAKIKNSKLKIVTDTIYLRRTFA
jgi:UDP-N-acetylmuramyl tripeptide synthase